MGTTGRAALGALMGVIVGTVGCPASIAVGLYTESLVGAGIGAADGGTAGAAAGLAVVISTAHKHAEKAKHKIEAAAEMRQSESNESETDSATDLCFAVLLYFKLSLLVFTGGYTTCIMFCTNPLACNFICVHILIIIIGKIEMHTLVAWPTSYSFR